MTCILYIQGAIIRVLTYRRYANITVSDWYFFVFSQPRKYAELLLSAYLLFAGTTWPFQDQGIQYRNLVGALDWWHYKKRWSRLFVYAIVLLFLPRSPDILFRNLYWSVLYEPYFDDWVHIEYWVCSSASTRQQPLAYQSGTTKNLELSHPV
jgi:hypothetical protein